MGRGRRSKTVPPPSRRRSVDGKSHATVAPTPEAALPGVNPFRPLALGAAALETEDPEYAWTWARALDRTSFSGGTPEPPGP